MALRSTSTTGDRHRSRSVVVLGGRWHNQLGSTLVLEAGAEGTLVGSYRTATGAGQGTTVPVRGSWDAAGGDDGAVLGFVVSWPTVHALTAWCGRYRSLDDTIEASWVMRTEAEPEDDWRSTFVGHDVFHRD